MKNFHLHAILSGCVVALLVYSAAHARVSSKEHSGYVPKKGFVPDAKTAIRIAVAVWSPIYGDKQIQQEKPYKAKLKNGVWFVEGSLPKEYTVGGVAYASISKRDGRILNVIHTK